jgi:hypothetical protein
MEIIYIAAAVSLTAFMLLATYDGFYLHLWKYRLYARKESSFEHLTHTIRAILFPLIVVFMLINQTSFVLFLTGTLIAVFDFVVLAIDAYSEKDSRKFMGGLPRKEYIIHLFSNGFHYGFIILILCLKLNWQTDMLLLVPIVAEGNFAAQFLMFVAENAVPGAVILAILHVLLYLDKTKWTLDRYRLKVSCC